MLTDTDFTLLREEVDQAVLFPDLRAIHRRGRGQRRRRQVSLVAGSLAIVVAVALVGVSLIPGRSFSVVAWQPPTGNAPTLPGPVRGPMRGAEIPTTQPVVLMTVLTADEWRTFAIVRTKAGIYGMSRTLDGGRTWKTWALPSNVVKKKPADLAIVGGQTLTVNGDLMTRDGGQSWSSRPLDPGPAVDTVPDGWVTGAGWTPKVVAIDPADGVSRPLRNQPGADGPWPFDATSDRPVGTVHEAADGSLWAQARGITQPTDDSGPTYLAVSHDRGRTWKVTRSPLAWATPDSADGVHGYGLGFVKHGTTYDYGLTVTDDGGQTWRQVASSGLPQHDNSNYTGSLVVLPDGSLLALRDTGQAVVLMRSTDGGQSFAIVPDSKDMAFLRRTSQGTVVATQHQVVSHNEVPQIQLLSTDGVHWSRGPEPPNSSRVPGQFVFATP